MAAVTAAVIGATATVASGAIAASQAGGGADKPEISKVPMDPNDRAMRDYFARLTVANANTRYPGFGAFTQSGGDPTLAQMNVKMPEMKPSEAAALGFVGGKGEDIPGLTHAEATGGMPGGLTTEQRLYLAHERGAQATAGGQEPGPWAARMRQLGGKVGRLEKRLEKFTPTPEIEPREARITKKLERLRGKQESIANPNIPGA